MKIWKKLRLFISIIVTQIPYPILRETESIINSDEYALILHRALSIRHFISSSVLIITMVFALPCFSQIYRLQLSSNPLNVRFEERLDSARVLSVMFRIRNQYIFNAYHECNVDSLQWKSGVVTAFMHIGPHYTIRNVTIETDSHSNPFNGIRNRYLNQPYDSIKMQLAAEDILSTLENNGYPFSQVYTFSTIQSEGVDYRLKIVNGPFFAFDTCHIEGDQVIRKSFLEAYTGIKTGSPYNEALFRKANEKLNQLPFLGSERIPQLIFIAGGKAKPYYYIKKKRSDQVNGIVGLAPNTTQSGSKSSIVLTGEFALRLNNLMRSAKVLSINWRSFRARSQELRTFISYPYILSKPIGADLSVNYVKFDTLYTVFQRQASIQ